MMVSKKYHWLSIFVLILTLSLSACFHDDSDDDEGHAHDINVNLSDEEVFDPDNANTNTTAVASLKYEDDESHLSGSIVFTGTDTPDTVEFRMAFAGEDGMLVYSLEDSGTDNTWIITESDEELSANQKMMLDMGMMYLVATFDDGTEIRGQILPHENELSHADLEAATDDNGDPIATDGSGNAFVTVNEDTGMVAIFVNIYGIDDTEVTAAHLHESDSDGVVIALEKTSSDGETPVVYSSPVNSMLDASELTLLDDNKLYINIHTQTNASGELRADIDSPH